MPTFPLPAGSALADGHVVGMTYTAYEVALSDGSTVYVPFVRVHPLQPATPLVTFS